MSEKDTILMVVLVLGFGVVLPRAGRFLGAMIREKIARIRESRKEK